MAPRPVAVRRPEISGRFQAIRLRQRQRAERRLGAADRRRHVRQFQYRRRRHQRHHRRRRRADLRHAAGLRRSTKSPATTGLLAEAVSYPDDFSSVSYRLRAEAKWHDGTPVTPEDVIFSFDASKKNSPQLAAYYRHVVKVEKTGEREVTFTFDGPGNRELPQIVGETHGAAQALVGRHRQERQETRRRRQPRSNRRSDRRLPHQGFHRRPHHRLRARQGLLGQEPRRQRRRNNFDELRFDYFRDTTVALEAFKADTVDWRIENSRQELGYRLRLSRGRATSACCSRNFRSTRAA